MRRGIVYVCVMVTAALAVAVPVAAAHSRVVVRLGLQYKPREIPVSGDGDTLARNLKWKTWGGPKAVAIGQVVEQERPSHVNHYYLGRVTLSHRAYCGNLRRTVYNDISVTLLGPSKGVFRVRTFGVGQSCSGLIQFS